MDININQFRVDIKIYFSTRNLFRVGQLRDKFTYSGLNCEKLSVEIEWKTLNKNDNYSSVTCNYICDHLFMDDNN